MHSVKIHKLISLTTSVFYRSGLWHRGDKLTVRGWRIKLFYCIYYVLFTLSLLVGAIRNENPDESIFLWEVSVIATILFVKLCCLTWKQNRILELMNRVCNFSICRDHDFNRVNEKLRRFSYLVIMLVIFAIAVVTIEYGVMPFAGNERTLFVKIGFPLDYGNHEYAFWIASAFLFTGEVISFAVILCSMIIWYLLLTCSLRYKVLASDLRMLGKRSEKRKGKISEKEKHNNFFLDLMASIDTHLYTKELINDFMCFFSPLFFLQISTSGLCICGSIYYLVQLDFNSVMFYVHVYTLILNISEIFMITYFGNEILLSSEKLSYSLFESDWIYQPQSTRKCIIIFSEYLKKPHELVIGKLYPLTLVTFTKILKSAYNMFNILQNLAH